MENPDSQPAGDSPEATPSPKPRTPIKIRRADAEPLYERIADKDAESVITHLKPIQPSGSRFNIVGLIIPLGVTAAILVGGWFGYRQVKEQSDRMLAAERGAADSDAALERKQRELADIKTEIRDARANLPTEIEKAKRDAATKADAEFAEPLGALTRDIETTVSAGRDAARKAEEELQRKLADLRNKTDRLRAKAEELETKNRELKVWLNAHTRTIHPKF